MLKANYISNEYFNAGSLLKDRRHNFSSHTAYVDDDPDHLSAVIPEISEFCDDIQRTVHRGSLVILFFSAAKSRPDITLATGGKKGALCYQHDTPTFDDLSRLEPFCRSLDERLRSDFQQSLSDEIPINDTSPKRICQYIRRKTGADVLTIRVNIKTLRWADIEVYYRLINAISDVIQSHLLTESSSTQVDSSINAHDDGMTAQ
jgi:hypothetical protein